MCILDYSSIIDYYVYISISSRRSAFSCCGEAGSMPFLAWSSQSAMPTLQRYNFSTFQPDAQTCAGLLASKVLCSLSGEGPWPKRKATMNPSWAVVCLGVVDTSLQKVFGTWYPASIAFMCICINCRNYIYLNIYIYISYIYILIHINTTWASLHSNCWEFLDWMLAQ